MRLHTRDEIRSCDVRSKYVTSSATELAALAEHKALYFVPLHQLSLFCSCCCCSWCCVALCLEFFSSDLHNLLLRFSFPGFVGKDFFLVFFFCAGDVFYFLFFSWRFCHGRSVGEGFETSRSLFRFSWVDLFVFFFVFVVVVREGGLGGSLDSGRGWMSCRGRSWRGWCFSSRRERRRLQTTRDHPMILM